MGTHTTTINNNTSHKLTLIMKQNRIFCLLNFVNIINSTINTTEPAKTI